MLSQKGVPGERTQERQAAVRRYVKRFAVDADDRRLRIDLHVLPVGLDGPAQDPTATVTVTF